MRLKLFLAVLLFPFAALADGLPRPDADGIADLANLLSPAEETQLLADIQDIRARTGVTLVVITMDRLANHGGAGQSLEAYATALFNNLRIGDAAKDDGVLLLVASDDRAMRIENIRLLHKSGGQSGDYEAKQV